MTNDKRRKSVVCAAVLLAFVATPIAPAGGSSGPGAAASSLKGKVKQLQAQVAQLQQQVQGIQLQPGPQGPQGAQGTQGNPGAAAVIGPDSVALGTQTTGNYVGSVATNPVTGLTGGAAGSEGSALTLGLDYSSTPAGDPALSANQAVFGSTGLIFEGAANTFESLVTASNPASDRTITLPNDTGTILLEGGVSQEDVFSAPTANSSLPLIFRFEVGDGSDTGLVGLRNFEVVDAWAVATSSDAGGSWVLEGAGGNAITNTVSASGVDQAITRATTINDAFSSVTGGTLGLDGTGTIDANVFVLAFPE